MTAFGRSFLMNFWLSEIWAVIGTEIYEKRNRSDCIILRIISLRVILFILLTEINEKTFHLQFINKPLWLLVSNSRQVGIFLVLWPGFIPGLNPGLYRKEKWPDFRRFRSFSRIRSLLPLAHGRKENCAWFWIPCFRILQSINLPLLFQSGFPSWEGCPRWVLLFSYQTSAYILWLEIGNSDPVRQCQTICPSDFIIGFSDWLSSHTFLWNCWAADRNFCYSDFDNIECLIAPVWIPLSSYAIGQYI